MQVTGQRPNVRSVKPFQGSPSFNICPLWKAVFCEIKPVRVLLLLAGVIAFAAIVPTEAQSVEIMTPLYRTLPGVFKN